jgi:pilus assembly protein Flp/PilA
MRSVIPFLPDESGAAAAEYALILAIIGAAISTGMVILGGDISSAYSSAATVIIGFSF